MSSDINTNVLDQAWSMLQKKRVEGKLVKESDLDAVWTALGQIVQRSLADNTRALVIPKLGTFAEVENGKGEIFFNFATDFLKETGTRQKRSGGKLRKMQETKLSYVGLSKVSKRSKELCKAILDDILWSLSVLVVKNPSYVELEFPSVGKLICKSRNLDFVFTQGGNPEFDIVEEKTFDDREFEYDEAPRRAPTRNNLVSHTRAPTTINKGRTASPATSALSATARAAAMVPPSVERLREKIIARGGAAGIHAMSRILRIMDDSGDGCLDRNELKYGLQDYGISINNVELDEMFQYFDRDSSGKINFDEFLVGLRGPMSNRRIELILKAFKLMDVNGDGVVTIEDLEVNYSAEFDPDVKSGRKTPAQALRAFLDNFDTLEKDGIVSEDEFLEYYKNLSASIDSDDYFELMIRNAWHMSGGKGQYANTTNRRVLVTKPDGSQAVEEIENDLYIKRDDQTAMRQRLGARAAGAKLDMYYSNDTQEKPKSSNVPKRITQTSTSRASNPAARVARANPTAATTRASHLQQRVPEEPNFQFQGGDESFAPMDDMPQEDPAPSGPTALAKLGVLLKEKRLTVDDFLLKIGANRVFGDPSISNTAFIRGITQMDKRITVEDAKEICRLVDADKNGSINVAELCLHVQGASAVDRVKATIIARGEGIHSLKRFLKSMDTNGDNVLNRTEIAEGFQAFGVKLSSNDMNDLFAYFDRDHNGTINVDELLIGIRGEMNDRRKALVMTAFSRLDRTGDGVVTFEDIEVSYDVSQHPDFISGKKTKRVILNEFLLNFDGNGDGTVTEEEFLDYYKSLSASIKDDNYFELMMRNAWHISGGQGQSANTTCKRVLVTDANGKQSVQEIKDDIYFDAKRDDVSKRLGLDKSAKVDMYYSNDSTQKPVRDAFNSRSRDTRPASSTISARQMGQARQMASARTTAVQSATSNNTTRNVTRSGRSASAAQPAPVRASVNMSGTQKGNLDMFFGAPVMGDESFPDEDMIPSARSNATPVTARSHGSSFNPILQNNVDITPRTNGRKAGPNPNVRKTAWQGSFGEEPQVVKTFRQKIIERGGSSGIHTLGRLLRIMDDSGDKMLDRNELKYGLQDYGLSFSQSQLDELFNFLDTDRSGKISFDEFLIGIRGPINKRRLALIAQAFQIMDRSGDGFVTLEDLEMSYDVSFHPDVKSGKLSKTDALREFLDQFDTLEKDGIVTGEEFAQYYKNVSASIDSDDYFELMMRNAWHLSGGKGQYENTTCKRVLVTQADGRETVEELKDDLYLGRSNQAIHDNLKKQGISGQVSHYYANDATSKPRKPYSNHSTLSLAWDSPDKATTDIKVKQTTDRERKLRQGAAVKVQALLRAKRASREVELERRRQRHSKAIEVETEQERLAESRRIKRTQGPNWY